jgi:hypothetical protein
MYVNMVMDIVMGMDGDRDTDTDMDTWTETRTPIWTWNGIGPSHGNIFHGTDNFLSLQKCTPLP